MRTFWILILRTSILCTVLLSCMKNGPAPLSREEKRLAVAYAELSKLKNRMTENLSAYPDSAATVLNKLQFSKEDYDRIRAALDKNPERWELFYRYVLNLLEPNPD